MSVSHDGGVANVDYMLMPLTEEESTIGGDFLGLEYALEHRDRWASLNKLIFNIQTYDRGYTRVHVNNRTYQLYQDILLESIGVRLYIGRYSGSSRDDRSGIQTVEMSPKNLFTWNELVDLGVVNDSANLVIDYSKLLSDDGRCLIGNTSTNGVQLVIPKKTTDGTAIVDVCTNNPISSWNAENYPAKYICRVILPEGLTSIGLTGAAFPMLGRNVVMHEISVKIPKTVTTIGEKAFYGSKLQSLDGSKPHEFTIDDGLASIGESAFENCGELSVIRFGPSLKTVGAKAFANCKKLQLHFRNTIETVADNACLLVGDVEYTPRIVEGSTVPAIVSKAPFQAKLWNGKVGYTPGFYVKPELPADDNPPVIPGDSAQDKLPLDLSGVIEQITDLDEVVDTISQP